MSELCCSVGTISACAACLGRFIHSLAWFPARACSPVATVKILFDGFSVSMTYLLSRGCMTGDVVPESMTASPSLLRLCALLIVLLVSRRCSFRIIFAFALFPCVVVRVFSCWSCCRCFASFRSQVRFNLVMACSDNRSLVVPLQSILFIVPLLRPVWVVGLTDHYE